MEVGTQALRRIPAQAAQYCCRFLRVDVLGVVLVYMHEKRLKLLKIVFGEVHFDLQVGANENAIRWTVIIMLRNV